MSRFLKLTALLLALVLLSGCSVTRISKTEQSGYFMDAFDTFIKVVGYAESEAAFDGWVEEAHQRFLYYHSLFDRFYEHSGVNNIRTINKNAGIAPVQVEPALLDLLEFAVDCYHRTGGAVNVCMGAVTDIWHNHMKMYSLDSTGAELPADSLLREAAQHCDINDLVIDREAGTVYLKDPKMMLDVGAIAKGYATQRVADELYALGFHHFAISAGGNILVKDAPQNGKTRAWSIGVTDPFDQNKSLDSLYLTNTSLVTSGDYQRFYMVGERRVHHLTDPWTLYPADHYRAVTVLCADSGMADAASTAMFVLDRETGEALAEKEGWEVMWVYPDGTVDCTDGFAAVCRDRGGATNELEE